MVAALEQGVERVAVHPLVLHEVGGDPAENGHVVNERAAGRGVGLAEDAAHRTGRSRLDLGRQRAVRTGDEERERAAAGRAVVLRVRVPAHAPLRHHGRGDLVGLLEVVRGAAGHFVEQELLGRAAAHEGDQPGPQVRFGRQVIVFLRADGDAEGLAVGEEADLLDAALVPEDFAADRVTHFVRGDDGALALVHRAMSRRPHGDLEPALVQILG